MLHGSRKTTLDRCASFDAASLDPPDRGLRVSVLRGYVKVTRRNPKTEQDRNYKEHRSANEASYLNVGR